MLIVCPACGARYEVPTSAIPSTGRIVRCSACRAEWRARPEALRQEVAVLPSVEPGPVEQRPVQPVAVQPTPLPQAASQVTPLADTADVAAMPPKGPTGTSEPVLAAATVENPALRREVPTPFATRAERAAPPPPPPDRGVATDDAATPPSVQDPAATPRSVGSGPPRPSALREAAAGDGAHPAHRLATAIDAEPEARGGTGFLAGFATVSILALAGAAAYIKHDAIVAALPALDGAMTRYVALVDAGRAALATFVTGSGR